MIEKESCMELVINIVYGLLIKSYVYLKYY